MNSVNIVNACCGYKIHDVCMMYKSYTYLMRTVYVYKREGGFL